jgi:hypothetical protein
MKKLTAILFFASVCTALFGQDFRQRVELMQKDYASMTKVHIEMDIQVFESKEAAKPYLQQTALVKRENQNFFYRISGIEMLMNEKYLLMIDGPSRQIVCSPRSIDEEQKFTDPLKVNLDSLLKLNGIPTWVDTIGDIEHYTMSFGAGQIKKMDLCINAVSNSLKRLDYWYEGDQHVRIEFKVFNTAPTFGEFDFDESKYIIWKGGAMKTSELYSRFRLSYN